MKALSLMYHDVVPEGAEDSSGFVGSDAALYKLNRDQFDRHLHALAAVLHGPPATVLDVIAGGDGAASPVFLTFDDGGSSAITHVAGRLEAFGYRGHFMVTTDYIDRPGFLRASELVDLVRRGHVVGSHSCSHPLQMSRCSLTRLDREWSASVAKLCAILGRPVRCASIPGGDYSRAVVETAARAGIEALFTSEPSVACGRIGDCRIFGRYAVRSFTSAAEIAAIVAGSRLPVLKQHVAWSAKKVFKAAIGERYLELRKQLLDRAASRATAKRALVHHVTKRAPAARLA